MTKRTPDSATLYGGICVVAALRCTWRVMAVMGIVDFVVAHQCHYLVIDYYISVDVDCRLFVSLVYILNIC